MVAAHQRIDCGDCHAWKGAVGRKGSNREPWMEGRGGGDAPHHTDTIVCHGWKGIVEEAFLIARIAVDRHGWNGAVWEAQIVGEVIESSVGSSVR